jgi:hypothetical protein
LTGVSQRSSADEVDVADLGAGGDADLVKICRRWESTVRGLRYNWAATFLVLAPLATSWATWSSCGVSRWASW